MSVSFNHSKFILMLVGASESLFPTTGGRHTEALVFFCFGIGEVCDSPPDHFDSQHRGYLEAGRVPATAESLGFGFRCLLSRRRHYLAGNEGNNGN